MKTSRFTPALAVVLLTVGGVLVAGQDNPKWNPKSMAILKNSVDYTSGLKSFTTTLYHKRTQDGGAKHKKREESMRYDVAFEGPNKLSLRIGEGPVQLSVVSDGETLWVHAPEGKVYTERRAPKTLQSLLTIDELKIVNSDLQNLLFLDQFLANDAFNTLMDGVVELSAPVAEKIGEDKTNHLKFGQENFDWNLWIQDGAKPLLRRVSIDATQTMKDADGPVEVKLSFVSQFDNWTVNEPIAAKTFVFVPPEGTKKVKTLAAPKEDYDPKLLGEVAPDFTAKLLDGTTFNLAEQKGKNIVILDFWATWCGPCRMAMPTFSQVMESYKGKGVLGYAVNLMEPQDTVAEFQKKTPELTLPILLDTEGKLAKAYRVMPIPMSVIVAKDGIIRAVHMGIPGGKVEILKKQLTAELDALIEGKPMPKPAEHGEPAAKEGEKKAEIPKEK